MADRRLHGAMHYHAIDLEPLACADCANCLRQHGQPLLAFVLPARHVEEGLGQHNVGHDGLVACGRVSQEAAGGERTFLSWAKVSADSMRAWRDQSDCCICGPSGRPTPYRRSKTWFRSMAHLFFITHSLLPWEPYDTIRAVCKLLIRAIVAAETKGILVPCVPSSLLFLSLSVSFRSARRRKPPTHHIRSRAPQPSLNPIDFDPTWTTSSPPRAVATGPPL